MKIQTVIGREILDSRGNPTVEAEIVLADGTRGRGAAPSGASTGQFEALELRDGDKSRYCGKGVRTAAEHINREIRECIAGMSCSQPAAVDAAMIQLDGTKDKSKLGANAMLAVSIALAKAAAKYHSMPLFRYLGGAHAEILPVPMMNVLNGGAHAANNLDVQEFMIMPVGAECFSEGLRWCAEVYHSLKKRLSERKLSTAVGDEGGFAPDLDSDSAALELLLEAIECAGYRPGKDFVLALDAAASEWKCGQTGCYRLPKSGKEYAAEELISYWESLCAAYPIRSVEDGLDEEDWQGWQLLTGRLGQRVQLVGDDLFVTNTERLGKGIQAGCGNAILIKPNQIGTLTETIHAIRMAQDAGYGAIVSHRSGETEDTTIADLAVALGTGQIKTGAPCRSERTAKYNRLLRIASMAGGKGGYMGAGCFPLRGGTV
ncbi:MAG: phosphopyruvate hydratase [Ruminococcus sp.]|nr:phosphopyruvate hydratase [Ruminococcus sp.]